MNLLEGVPARSAVAADARARVRTEVGREFFRAEYGRDPVDARELAGLIAKLSRPQTTAVAGFDLTFSPVKSVSTLWALADPTMAATIERCHQAAIGDALKLIEDHALYTRTGAHGVRQVNVRGLVAAAFTHRDSRAGDPDLQPDAGPASQSLAGKWQATINSPMGSQQLLLDYRLDGTALTGTVTLGDPAVAGVEERHAERTIAMTQQRGSALSKGLGGLFLGAGIIQATKRDFFQELVPARFAGQRVRLQTVMTGALAGLGLSFLIPRLHPVARWVATAVLVGTLPAAVGQVRNPPEVLKKAGLPPALVLARIPAQVLVVILAWLATRSNESA